MGKLFVEQAGIYRVAEDAVVLQFAQASLARRFRVGAPVLQSPQQTKAYLQLRLAPLDYETFGLIHLDARHRLLAMEDLFRGTIDGASVHPREIVKSAILRGSAAIIAYHNHPSGCSQSSAADDLITHRIRDVLAMIDVRFLDHLVVGLSVYSYAEAGRL